MQIVDSGLGNRSGHKLECFPEASVCSASVGYNSQEGLLLYHVCSVLLTTYLHATFGCSQFVFKNLAGTLCNNHVGGNIFSLGSL